MHEVLVNRLEGLSLPRKSVVRLTDRPNMTMAIYRGRKRQQHNNNKSFATCCKCPSLLACLFYFKNLTDVVVNWIIATKKHQTPEHLTAGAYGQTDLHYFLDMDMAVLGRPNSGVWLLLNLLSHILASPSCHE